MGTNCRPGPTAVRNRGLLPLVSHLVFLQIQDEQHDRNLDGRPGTGHRRGGPDGCASAHRTRRRCPGERGATKGWIAFSAKTEAGDWDLFICRPDGSDRRPLTTTRDFHEAGVRFSPDGERILYYRMPKSEPLDNNTYGTFELIMADADGSHAETLGPNYRWATWGPDGSQIACLAGSTIRIVNLTTRKTVRDLPRKGIVQQLGWSPDGKWFAGTANGLGPYWNIGRMNADTGAVNAVSETDRYNCTPDWFPDSQADCLLARDRPRTGRFRGDLDCQGRWHGAKGGLRRSKIGTCTAAASRPTAATCCSLAPRRTSGPSSLRGRACRSSAWRTPRWSWAKVRSSDRGFRQPTAVRGSICPGAGSRIGPATNSVRRPLEARNQRDDLFVLMLAAQLREWSHEHS